MSDVMNALFFTVICTCLGIDPETDEASAMIIPAYQEPETAPRPPRNRDVIYYSLLPEDVPGERFQTFSQDNGFPIVNSFEPYRLTVICYGPHAEENARRIRAFFLLDGFGMPRKMLRQNGVYPLVDPAAPSVGYEEEGSLWRKRADLVISLRVLEERRYFSGMNNIRRRPEVVVHRG